MVRGPFTVFLQADALILPLLYFRSANKAETHGEAPNWNRSRRKETSLTWTFCIWRLCLSVLRRLGRCCCC
jgi:hypothetical protein